MRWPPPPPNCYRKEDRLQLQLIECLNNYEKKDLFSAADRKSDQS